MSAFLMERLRRLPRYTIDTAVLLIRLARFVAIVALFALIYKFLLEHALDGGWQIFLLLILWLLSAYLVLPFTHRKLTKYYLPNYFVGRVRSGSGLLSDPVNLAFFGSAKQLHKAMRAAGWTKADPLTPHSFWRALRAAILKKSYAAAPVGNMYLFNRQQDFAYEQEVGGNPRERHHVRFWKVPAGWRLPGGHSADWLAAATYDTNLGIKSATGQIDHKIAVDVDEERDFIIDTLKQNKQLKSIEVVQHFTDAYHDHNNGGDRIKTDGSLPFLTLR